MRKRRSTKSYEQRLHDIHGSNITLCEPFTKREDKLLHKCYLHGYFKQRPRKILYYNRHCQKCNRLSAKTYHPPIKTHEKYKIDLYNKYGNKFAVIENYINSKTPILHKCTKNHTFKKPPATFLSRKTICPHCREAINSKISKQAFEEILNKFNKNTRLIKYNGFTKPGKFLCKIHDYVFITKAVNVVTSKNSCKKCLINSINHVVSYNIKLKGIELKFQGFEPMAVKYLANKFSLNKENIKKLKNVPIIRYKLDGKIRHHIPDFYIDKIKTVFEVKSVYTFFNENFYNKNIAKAKYANKKYHYKFILVSSKGSCIILPKYWFKTFTCEKLKYNILTTFNFLDKKALTYCKLNKSIVLDDGNDKCFYNKNCYKNTCKNIITIDRNYILKRELAGSCHIK